METHRRLIRVLWWCVCLACMFGLVFAWRAQVLPDGVFWMLYGLLLLLVILSWLAISLLWHRGFLRTVRGLEPLLEEDPDRYLAEIGALLEGKRAEQNRALLRFQLCLAYSRRADYAAVKAQLLALRPEKLRGTYRLLYDLNLAYACFHLGERETAMAIMDRRSADLTRYEENPHLRETIAALRAFANNLEG